jgi:hypothetical protein
MGLAAEDGPVERAVLVMGGPAGLVLAGPPARPVLAGGLAGGLGLASITRTIGTARLGEAQRPGADSLIVGNLATAGCR